MDIWKISRLGALSIWYVKPVEFEYVCSAWIHTNQWFACWNRVSIAKDYLRNVLFWSVAMNHQHTPNNNAKDRGILIEQSTGKYAMVTHIWYSMFTSSCLPVTFEMPDNKIRLSYFIHNRRLVLHIRTARVCVHRLVCYFLSLPFDPLLSFSFGLSFVPIWFNVDGSSLHIVNAVVDFNNS